MDSTLVVDMTFTNGYSAAISTTYRSAYRYPDQRSRRCGLKTPHCCGCSRANDRCDPVLLYEFAGLKRCSVIREGVVEAIGIPM